MKLLAHSMTRAVRRTTVACLTVMAAGCVAPAGRFAGPPTRPFGPPQRQPSQIAMPQQPGPGVVQVSHETDALPAIQPLESAGAQPLTLAALERTALAHNPTLRQAAAAIQRAQGSQLQAGLRPNPTFGLQGTEIGNDGHAGQQGFYFAQEIMRGGKLEKSQAVAGGDINLANWRWHAQQARILNDVRRGFYRVLGAQRETKLASKLLKISNEAVTQAEDRLEAEFGTEAQVLQAKIDRSGEVAALRGAESRRLAARRTLATLVGIGELPGADLVGDLEAPVPEIVWEAGLQRLVAESPELQAARAAVERAQLAVVRAEAEPVPNVTAQIALQQDFATDFTIVSLQAAIPLPTSNRNQGNIMSAQADVMRAVAEVERLEFSLRGRFAEAYGRFESLKAKVAEHRNHILPDARRSQKLISETVQEARVDFAELLAVRRRLFRAEQDYVQALTELWLSVVDIEGLLLRGGLNEPE